jgi:hypothetical protein
MGMPLFTARAKRNRGWWVLVVSEVPGALTHVQNRDDAGAKLREAIARSLDIPQDSFNVQVDFDVLALPSLQHEGNHRAKATGHKMVGKG